MPLIGSIGHFDETLEDFETYVSSVELYFVANEIPDDKKVAVFLRVVGLKVIHFLKVYCLLHIQLHLL